MRTGTVFEMGVLSTLMRCSLLLSTCLVLSLFAFSGCSDSNSGSGGGISIMGGGDLDKESFARAMKGTFEAAATDTTAGSRAASAKMPTVKSALSEAYELHDYKPFWLDNAGNPKAQNLIAALEKMAASEGLPPAERMLETLKSRDAAFGKEDLSAAVAWDKACTEAYLTASRQLLLGKLIPKQGDSLWFHANDSLWKGAQILAAASTDNPAATLDSFRSEIALYKSLQEVATHFKALDGDSTYRNLRGGIGKTAPDSVIQILVAKVVPNWNNYASDSVSGAKQSVLAAQAYFGLKPTGKTDSTLLAYLTNAPATWAARAEANMERLRWLPRQMEESYVRVNIPYMMMQYVSAGRVEMEMRAVVGKPARQTPSLGANMVNVVLNPSWGVPPTILKNDVGPGVARSGGGYLARKGLRAYDSKGREVPRESVNSSNFKRYMYKQAPGARNALGEVKFNLPNKWDIYLHDTPHEEDFPKRYRALSSGCIRLQDPKQFAEFVLAQKDGKTTYTPAYIDSVIDTRQTKFVQLTNKIPVHIVYLTADEVNGQFQFLGDIYKKDAKLIRKLAEQN